MIQVKIKMEEGCEDLFPKQQHRGDAGFDIRSKVDMEIEEGKTILVPTGIHVEVPVGYELQVRPRSGTSLKESVIVVNSPGTVDSSYRGEVGVIMHKLMSDPCTMRSDITGQKRVESFKIKRGDRIAQAVINKLPEVEFIPADELSDTTRGTGGFGSTGK